MYDAKSGLLDINLRIQCAFSMPLVVFVHILTVRNINKDYERNEKSSQIEEKKKNAHLGGGMDCVTALYAEVTSFNPTEKEQEFVRFSFYHDPLYHYLIVSVNCPHSYSCTWEY